MLAPLHLLLHLLHNLIEHQGKLVVEQYWPGIDQDWGTPLGIVSHGSETLHDLRSVTKSVTSLLLGIALEVELQFLALFLETTIEMPGLFETATQG